MRRMRQQCANSSASPKKRGLLLAFLELAGFGAVVMALLIAAFAYWFNHTYSDNLRHVLVDKPPVVRVLARDGAHIARHSLRHPHINVEDMPQTLIDAITATEDRRFFDHWGLDPVGLSRAVWTNLTTGRMRQGGSTITQQLVKNVFLSRRRTLTRKFRELVISFWLEWHYSKAEILEFYLNRVYFGAGASHGIEASVQRYFSKPAAQLNLPEAALMAGLLKAPSYYTPLKKLHRAHKRAAVVLDNMQAIGAITPQQADEAKRYPAQLKLQRVRVQLPKGSEYAHDWIMEQLKRKLGPINSNLVVETSLDLALQQKAQGWLAQTIADNKSDKQLDQAAALMLDETGGVRLMIGGASYAKSQFNRAVKARRQPGSGFKPVVYLAAMEAGQLPTSVRLDEPVQIDGWRPRNASRSYRGAVTLQQALAYSVNSVAVQLASDLGHRRVLRTARRLGINSQLTTRPSYALGASEVSLLELTGAYTPFMNGGYEASPHIIKRVRTQSGEVLYEHEDQKRRIIRKLFVADMNNMLGAVVSYGTGKRARLEGHPTAGKTGTSQNYRDAWFIGYTGHFTGGVWLGNDDGSPMNKVSGGKLPAQLWRKIMSEAHQGLKRRELPGLNPANAPSIPSAIIIRQQRPDASIIVSG